MTRTAKLLATFCFTFSLNSAHADSLKVESLWVREAPPQARSLAAYGKITNVSDKPVVLSEFGSNDFERAQLHQSRVEGGMVGMKHLARVTLAPGQAFEMAPEGNHLMLIGPKHTIRAGDTVSVQIRLKGGETVVADAVVKRDDQSSSHHGMHHSH